MTMSAEVLALWDFGDPAGSRARFEEAAREETDPGRRRVWLTQVARAHGLAEEFGEAHAVLDGLEDGGGRVALERGRVLRSSGDVAGSIPFFRRAFEDSLAAGERGLAADAAHMLAIVLPEEHERWAGIGLEVAEGSEDPLAQAMTGALLNNLGWKHADAERWAEAYELFDRAVRAREAVVAAARGKASTESLHVARWCRARAARALGRDKEALAELRELDQSDPHVQEEISLLS